MDSLFQGIFTTAETSTIGIQDFLMCMGAAIVLGLIMAMAYSYKTKTTKSFVATLAILPVVVAMVIIMVNGSIGTGIAVAGAFSLVRFRSVPGTAKEIGAIFIAMGTGLTIGMGFIGLAFLFVMIVCIFRFFINLSKLGDSKKELKILKITIPESLNYSEVFNDILEKYTNEANLVSVKTSNMGSFFKLNYEVELQKDSNEKAFIDELRCRNGNLEIMITNQSSLYNEL